ncbi:MAG: polysaccharide biosynthesis C-terminal domain-containing protein [Acidimicrobiales bacterium]
MTEPTAGARRGSSMLAGSGVLLGGRLVVAALGWAGTLVVARQLSPDDWGAYSLVFSLLGLVSLITDLRVGRLVLGELLEAGEAGGPVIGSYLTMRLALGVVGYGWAMVVVVVGDFPRQVVVATAVTGVVLVLGAADASLDLFLSSRMWWRTQALAPVVGQAVQLGLILAIAAGADGAGVGRYAATTVAFSAVAVGWKLAVIGRHMALRLRIEPARWRTWAREAWAVALGGAIAVAYFRIDSLMLSQLDTLESVGLYGVGYKFSDLAGFVAFAVCTPMFTLLVGSWPHDPAGFGRAFRQAFALLVVGGVGLAAVFAVFALPLMETFYGARFGPASGAARLLMVGQAVNYLTTLCFFALLAAGRNRRYVVAASAGLGLNVGLNLVLIPAASYRGAAAATVVTEVVVLAILGHAALALPGLRPLPWRMAGMSLLSAAVMGGAAALVVGRLPWPLAALASGAVYLLGLAALGAGRAWRELSA